MSVTKRMGRNWSGSELGQDTVAEIKRESVASWSPCLSHFSATPETERPRAAPRALLNSNGLIGPHCRPCCIGVVLVGLKAEGNLCRSLGC